MDNAFFDVLDNIIALESTYKYKGASGQCHYTAADVAFRIRDCTDVTVNHKNHFWQLLISNLSLSLLKPTISFQLYKSGVYSGNCWTKLDHGVLEVGYGIDNGQKFIKVKNWWGWIWGSGGYILIGNKGDGKGQWAPIVPNCMIDNDIKF